MPSLNLRITIVASKFYNKVELIIFLQVFTGTIKTLYSSECYNNNHDDVMM